MRSQRRKPAKRYSLPLVPVFSVMICSLFFSAASEWISRGSLSEVLLWRTESPGIFNLNALLIGCIILACYGLIGSLFPALAATAGLIALFTFINDYKTRLIGEPFYPWDVVLNREGLNIASAVTGSDAWLHAGEAAALVLFLLGLRFVWGPYVIKLRQRMILILVPAILLVSFGTKAVWISGWLDRAGVYEITWNQQENYHNNGLLLAFTLNIKNAIITKPAGYGEAAMTAMAGSITEQHKAGEAVKTAESSKLVKSPNVIMVMSEAFWDPTLLQNVTYSHDPLPTVHRLQKEQTHGFLLSPQFGGGTSNVEFEVLTGLSMSLLPAGSIPYQQYIDRPLPSLASYFRSEGYSSKAIHSYEGWFWSRNKVYEAMGFESFKSLADFVEPEYKGPYVSDDEVARSIIREVEDSEKPMFIYAVTMQNHGPYNDNRYGSTTIKAGGNLSEEARDVLETYAQGAYDADQSLNLMIEHFQESDEPTVIVFFGDHLPMMGYNYDVYREAGFLSSSDSHEWSLEELKGMHSVPFVLWSNYKTPKEEVPLMSTSYLGSYLLDRLSMEQPPQWQFTSSLFGKAPGLLRNLTADDQGRLYETAPESLKKDLEEYRLLQYDILFGEQYLSGR